MLFFNLYKIKTLIQISSINCLPIYLHTNYTKYNPTNKKKYHIIMFWYLNDKYATFYKTLLFLYSKQKFLSNLFDTFGFKMPN